MTYRTKVIALLVGLVVITNGLLTIVEYRRSEDLLKQEFHRKARSVVSTAAALLDPELVKSIRRPADQTSADYGKLKEELQKIRDFNRRKDVWIGDIFTLIPAPQNPRYVEYGVDAEDRFAYEHHAGDIYRRDGQPLTIGIEGINRLADNLQGFQDGFNAAFAPIRDKSGNLIAMLGVSLVPAPYSTLDEIGTAMIIPFVATVVMALIVAVILGHSVSRPLNTLRAQIDQIAKGDFNSIEVPANLSGQFRETATAIAAMAKGLRERETIRRAFSGYISRQVLETILEKGELSALKGERRRITVLFADIRGFTAISEGMRPEEVVQMLSEFFDRMVEVLMRHQGTIDKFLGDGMMVIFGAPVDDPYQEEHAVRAAVEMQDELLALCKEWEAKGRRAIKMGIGINSGAAIVGNIGSETHMEYTAVGDTVNLASRLESSTKELGLDIIVSEQTYSAVRPLFQWKSAGEITIRGRTDTVRAFSVEGTNGKPNQLAS
ncbi:MAG TPA: adenylate/guanylate cyclase domain-containing protein [Candidatus Binataceae bacterium]|nr:adenylate/guanylate cyclase domain-containing protein [Candidatus Binataceae bacterium]